MVRREVFFTLAVAAILVFAGCEAPSGGDLADEPITEGETPTVAADTTPTSELTLETPVSTDSELEPSAGESPTTEVPNATPTIRLTPTPSPTSVPPGPAVKKTAQSLSTKLTAFRSAIRAQGRPERAAQLQLDLLNETQSAEAALKDDKSPQAATVREAIESIRSGASGNQMSLDDASTNLRSVLGPDGSGTPSANLGTRTPGRGTSSGAGGSLGQGSDPVSLAEAVQEKLTSYQQAQRERNTDNLLRKQADLVDTMIQADAALAGDESAEAKRLREAIANLNKGLQGSQEALTSGTSAIGALGGAASTDQNQTGGDVSTLADGVDTELSALREALATNDPATLLRQQGELLQAVEKAEKAISGDPSPEAEKLRSALKGVRAGTSGDRAKLDGAANQLHELGGGGTAEATDGATGTTGAAAVDPGKAATTLQDKVDAMQKAVAQGSSDDILKAQNDLTDAVAQFEPGVQGGSTRGTEALKGAIDAIRKGLGGDVSKFDEADKRLSEVSGGGSAPSGTGTRSAGAGTPSSGSGSGSIDVKPVADHIQSTLNKVVEANKSDNPEAAAKARSDAQAEFDKLAKELPSSGADAQKVRSLLDQARGAASGDQTKLEAARKALEDARR